MPWISFFTIRPTGMPVQSATTEATACSSTWGKMSGLSPCRPRSSVSASRRSARSLAVPGRPLEAGAEDGVSAGVAGPQQGQRILSKWLRQVRADRFFQGAAKHGARGFCPRRLSLFSTLLPVRCAAASPSRVWNPRRRSARRGRDRCAVSRSENFELGLQCIRCARRQSSTCGGVACWLMATRAHAVSMRLTALSGNCRDGM